MIVGSRVALVALLGMVVSTASGDKLKTTTTNQANTLKEEAGFWERQLQLQLSFDTFPPVFPAPVVTIPVTIAPSTSSPSRAPVAKTPPVPVTPAPVTPAPVTPAPVTPAPVTSAPVTLPPISGPEDTPRPITSSPVTGSPVTAAPVTPAPVTPAPVTPAPVTAAPVADPVTPAPVADPVTPAPVTPAPITPAPVTPAPVTPAPVTPAPVTPAPATPAPVTPSPITAAPITPAPITAAPITAAPVAPVAAPLPPSPGFPLCSVCGVGLRVTIPDGVVNVPNDDPTTCAIFERAGLNGFVDPLFCSLLPGLATNCGCAPVPVTSAPVASPGSAVRTLIESVALQGGAEFADPDSVQSQALAWLEADSATPGLPNERLIQRYALACIWFGTVSVQTPYTDAQFGAGNEVPGWIDADDWLGDSSECEWFGISCDDSDRVTEIGLANNRLTGTFPPEVVLLASSLTVFDIVNNLVFNQGDEELAFLGDLTSLTILSLGSTNFQYDRGVPTEIGQLTNLEEFDGSYTLFEGQLVGETFQNMPALEFLVLSGTFLNGTIPPELGALPNLSNLYLEFTDITGNLSFLEPMESIFEFWIDNTPGLDGSLPTFLGELTTLASLSVEGCTLTGTIPTTIGLLGGLQQVWLNANSFTGTIPTEVGQLQRLAIFEAFNNDLVGTMPTEVCDNVDEVITRLVVDCVNEVECDCCTNCF